MTKESIYHLQKIDCNCNDCGYMVRDLEKYKTFDHLYANEKGTITSPAHRLNFGYCQKFDKPVSFIPNVCQLDTQNCFEHRKDVIKKAPVMEASM